MDTEIKLRGVRKAKKTKKKFLIKMKKKMRVKCGVEQDVKSGRNKSEMEEKFLWNDNHIIHPLCTKNEFFK